MLSVWLAACADPNAIAALQVCDAACACTNPIPSAREACVEECQVELQGEDIPDDCVICAEEAACSELDDCFDRCFDFSEEG